MILQCIGTLTIYDNIWPLTILWHIMTILNHIMTILWLNLPNGFVFGHWGFGEDRSFAAVHASHGPLRVYAKRSGSERWGRDGLSLQSEMGHVAVIIWSNMVIIWSEIMTIYGSNIWSWCNWTKNDRNAECRGIQLPKFPESIVGLYPTMHALYSTSFTKKNQETPIWTYSKKAVQAQKIDTEWRPTSPSHGQIAIGSSGSMVAHWPHPGWMVEQGFIDVTQDWRPTPSDVHNKPIGSKSGCPQVDSGCSWKMLFSTCTFWTELSFDKRTTSMPKSWQSHQSTTRWCIRQRLEDASLHALCRAKPLSRRYLWCCNPAGGWHLDWSWAKPQGFTIQVAKPLKFLHMSVSKNDEWMTIDHIWHHMTTCRKMMTTTTTQCLSPRSHFHETLQVTRFGQVMPSPHKSPKCYSF